MLKRLTTSKQRENIKKIKTSFIHGLTAQQVDNYIDSNVIDLASAKEVLKKLAKILVYIIKK